MTSIKLPQANFASSSEVYLWPFSHTINPLALKPLSKDVAILKEAVTLSDVKTTDLTSDCHFVYRENGDIDIARGESMVKIFDLYHDKKIKISRIVVSGGRLNPKMNDPRI